MITLDEDALKAAAATVELQDEAYLDPDEAAEIRLAQARAVVTSYMRELAAQSGFTNAIAVAANIAEAYSDLCREKATVWAPQNQELSGRYQQAAEACDEVAGKIRSSAEISLAN
ncbi:hypothetical protein [Bosea sp. (in: a-proteobacteria)]|jgi:hypothetical protein|uniref:hypothetical protein n=1 Tax=Bosea sp. (in: a-proteobacteria) TaxID=1871050 RepID=UPI001ACFFCC2|nr:hypothetical protein [Bosea sp. (in: a-proteobacteria)]MBN9438510.1 hypothetical protein [Bosea sp. (in: a-proteobacteria)]